MIMGYENMYKITCCYKCPRRKVTIVGERAITCHMTCPDYIEQSKLNAERREKERAEKQFDYDRLRIVRLIRKKTHYSPYNKGV